VRNHCIKSRQPIREVCIKRKTIPLCLKYPPLFQPLVSLFLFLILMFWLPFKRVLRVVLLIIGPSLHLMLIYPVPIPLMFSFLFILTCFPSVCQRQSFRLARGYERRDDDIGEEWNLGFLCLFWVARWLVVDEGI